MNSVVVYFDEKEYVTQLNDTVCQVVLNGSCKEFYIRGPNGYLLVRYP